MGYQVLARKYRPQRFADVAGQDHVTRTLLNALTLGRIAHGYIFSGHRGIGKTTIARILAMALNCQTGVGTPERPSPEPCGNCMNCREISAATRASANPFEESHSFDVEEIDAATHRGIDDAKLLTQKVLTRPSLKSKYRILILDEAHQITDAAWNALLKTLEEPPDWAIFMFATTQPEDVPQTIRSRCQHFSFHAVRFEDILAQLRMIAEKEQVQAEDAALALLAEAGDGSMRDALSIMDQAIASAPVENGRPLLSALQIRELMGSVPNAIFERMMEAVAAGQSADLMEQVNVLLNAGHSPTSLARQVVRYLRNTLMAKLGGEKTELLQISADERARSARSALLFTEEEITRNLQIMLTAFDALNETQEHRFHLELGLLKMVHAQRLLPIEQLLSNIGGGLPVRSAPQSTGSRVSPPARSAPPASALSSSPFGSSGIETNPAPLPRSSGPVASIAQLDRPTSSVRTEPATEASLASPLDAASMATSPAQPGETAAITEPEPVRRPAGLADITEAPKIENLRLAVISALADGGHATAAQLLGSGAWIIDGSSLRIEIPGITKKMLSLTVNAPAEKIIRQELQRLAAPSRFLILPGEGSAAASAAPVVSAGSIEETALANPLVQRAKEIFQAEVRSVVDLRTR